ncbi:hypothetical protein [Flavobacterium sp. ASW18X]|uniref:hypothetical protein n=1 Tax=Flavobacterium sp. ASW18X TaxID=2572595 RepID=UPI0010ADD7AD|nr:hypothetical protein [Flavobacterium sp. ASW18X]TKD66565.1 hypothetical protein FBT53_01540 [Flavobacterium sp. ASW18X]
MALQIKETNNIIFIEGSLSTSNLISLRSYLMPLLESGAQLTLNMDGVVEINNEVVKEMHALKRFAFEVNAGINYVSTTQKDLYKYKIAKA